jgi:hypothetical protein
MAADVVASLILGAIYFEREGNMARLQYYVKY